VKTNNKAMLGAWLNKINKLSLNKAMARVPLDIGNRMGVQELRLHTLK